MTLPINLTAAIAHVRELRKQATPLPWKPHGNTIIESKYNWSVFEAVDQYKPGKANINVEMVTKVLDIFETLCDELESLDRRLEDSEKQSVWGFYEEEYPVYTDKAGCHPELGSVMDANDANGLVEMLKTADLKIIELKNELREAKIQQGLIVRSRQDQDQVQLVQNFLNLAKQVILDRDNTDPTDFEQLALPVCGLAIKTAQKAMVRFPQPNYVAAKLAEECGEVIRAYIHMSEGRGSRNDFNDEVVQMIGLALRLWYEGDQTITNNAAVGLAAK